MTVVDRERRRDTDGDGEGVSAALVGRVHAAVGEATTQRHTTDEEAGRPRLALEDERALSQKLIGDEVERLAGEALRAGRPPLSDSEEEALAAAVFDRLHGMARVQPLLDDPEI